MIEGAASSQVREPFRPGEARIGDAAMAAVFGPLLDLGREHVGQVGEMGALGPLGPLREPFGLSSDHRGPQFSCGRSDGGEGGFVGHGHRSFPFSSWS